MKHGKKYTESLKAYDKSKAYEIGEAVDLVLNTAKAKFDERQGPVPREGREGRSGEGSRRGFRRCGRARAEDSDGKLV